MSEISNEKHIDIKKNESNKDAKISPEEEKKAVQAFNNPYIISNLNFITTTNEAQNDANLNTENTINKINLTTWETRKTTENIINKYWLRLNVNYWGDENINKTNNEKTTKKEMVWVNDFLFLQWASMIDDDHTDQIRGLRNDILRINKLLGRGDWDPQELNRQKQEIIDKIFTITWIVDPDFKNYLNNYDGTSDNEMYKYLQYQSTEWKNELAKNVVNILKISDNPFEDIKNNYSTASEDQKIQIARMFSSLLNANYKDDWTNPSDKEMTNAVKNYLNTWKKMSAWVCRHIHSATAQLLQDLWLEAWLITTNSTWWHAITLWKKEDGSYFFIDYGTIYEGKDLETLQAQYLAAHGSMDLWETISTPNGKVIGFIKTFLEEQVSKNASVLWTSNTALYSKKIAEQGSLNTLSPGEQAIDANITTDKNANISYQQGWENTQIGIDASQINSNEWNLTSVGISGKLYLWKDNNTAIGAKIGKQNIDYTNWENTNKFSGSTISISWEKVKNLYTSNDTKVNIGVTTQGTVLLSDRNNTSTGFDKIQDTEHESALTIAWEQKIGKNIDIKANVGVREITDFSNERSENMVKPYLWFQAWGTAQYNFNKWWNIGVTGEYSTMVWERTFSTWLQGANKSWTVALNYTQTTPTIAFGEKETQLKLLLTKNISKNTQLYINWWYTNKKAEILAGFKVNL